MKIFFVDESNISFNKFLKFFIYGGIIIDDKDLRLIVKKFYKLKDDNNIPRERPIKWNNYNWNKEGILNRVLHAEIKEKIINLIIEFNCKIIVYLVPHDFYHDLGEKKKNTGVDFKYVINPKSQIKTIKYAINVCVQKFNEYINNDNCFGLIFADDFDPKDLKINLEKHCFSLYPDGSEKSNLERIIYPIIQINEQYSPAHQINDVLLGAIQSSLKENSINHIKKLKNSFWSKNGDIIRFGFNIYPINIKKYNIDIQSQIQNLKKKFKRLIS